MIFRKIAFVLGILFFAAIAAVLVADLIRTRKKIDKQGKNITAKTNAKTRTKKSYYR